MNCSEYKVYESIFSSVKGTHITVRPVPKGKNELGYTSARDGIYVAYDHPLMKDLNEKEKKFFRMGVFVHEMLHQCFTDFSIRDTTIKNTKDRARASALAVISNVLEDPAIEYEAPNIIGGGLLQSLRFTIATIYNLSPEISVGGTPFNEFINALINFGDMGPIRGTFTFSEAKTIFKKVAPIFYKGIMVSSSKERFHISEEICDISEPLWRMNSTEDMADLIKGLSNQGKGASDGTRTPIPVDDSADGEDSSKKCSRRKAVMLRFDDEEGEADSGDEASDEENSITDDDSSAKENETEKMGGEKREDGNDGKIEPEKSENTENKKSKKGFSDCTGEITDEKKSSNSSETDDKKYDDSIDESEYHLTEEDEDFILKQIEKERYEEEAEKRKNAESDTPILNADISSSKMSPRSCCNRRVSLDSARLSSFIAVYNETVSRYASAIKTSTNALDRLFKGDMDEIEHRSSGRLNEKRACRFENRSLSSTRIFDKRTLPGNKKDVAIEILVDESGSMWNKCCDARDCAICLREIFDKLNIPVYIMGFTADMNVKGKEYGVVHNHYVRWNSRDVDKYSLLNIGALYNNCDGYSIRYAGKVLEERKETHRLLIVISDGAPLAEAYRNGISDTADAVREVKRNNSVLGVAIGNDDTETIRGFYGEDFMCIQDTQNLFINLINRIKKIVDKW